MHAVATHVNYNTIISNTLNFINNYMIVLGATV